MKGIMQLQWLPTRGKRSNSIFYFIFIVLSLAAAANVFGNQHDLLLMAVLLGIAVLFFALYLRRRQTRD